jgi:N-acetylglucosaminyldiphosphoundecaprenol N-acetyl-beta-D-mannosaminyltransferase
MRKKYPSIVATYSPPFTQHFTRQENKMIIKKIKQAKVKIIYVALGSYRQDQWVIEHSKQFPQCTFITVGSAFDILSGIVPRAPLWMQHMGLEWLWRIWIDPKRLVKRYLEDIYRLLKLLFIHTNPASYKEIFDIHLQKDRYARP